MFEVDIIKQTEVEEKEKRTSEEQEIFSKANSTVELSPKEKIPMQSTL